MKKNPRKDFLAHWNKDLIKQKNILTIKKKNKTIFVYPNYLIIFLKI